jgi:hypothetical protein
MLVHVAAVTTVEIVPVGKYVSDGSVSVGW